MPTNTFETDTAQKLSLTLAAEDIETTIRQVIDRAPVSEQVIDVFDAARIRKPDISIRSEKFLAELKGYEHKNVALKVLKKLLSDELKARAKRNLVQSRAMPALMISSPVGVVVNGVMRSRLSDISAHCMC